MYIYKTTNKITGKIYIGKRIASISDSVSYIGSGKILKCAIEKYGRKNFNKEIIEECNSLTELNIREIFWIGEFNSTDRNIGYNITKGGNGGDVFTNNPNKQLIREKISKIRKGHIVSSETRRKIGLANKGKSHIAWNKGLTGIYSEETLLKIKESLKGRPSPMKGKKMSEISRLKMSIGRKGRPSPRKGVILSEETRLKISIATKKNWSIQSYKEMILSSRIKKYPVLTPQA